MAKDAQLGNGQMPVTQPLIVR